MRDRINEALRIAIDKADLSREERREIAIGLAFPRRRNRVLDELEIELGDTEPTLMASAPEAIDIGKLVEAITRLIAAIKAILDLFRNRSAG